MMVSAMMPPKSPARMDSIGKPGTGDGGIDVVVAVELVVLELVVLVVSELEVVSELVVVSELEVLLVEVEVVDMLVVVVTVPLKVKSSVTGKPR